MEETNAVRRDYKRNGQLKGSKSSKWKNIIRPMFAANAIEEVVPQTVEAVRRSPSAAATAKNLRGASSSSSSRKKAGSGIDREFITRKDYVFWDDPNELVDRLRLLIAEEEAGHTGHSNEIISIIEELREADVIE